MRRRREAFLQENNISFLNVVKAGQFNFPAPTGGWANNNNLRDVIPVIRGDENLFFVLRSANTSFDVLVYEYTGIEAYNGVIKSASDLTFRANLGSTSFSHSTVSQTPTSIQYVNLSGTEYLYVYSQETKIGVFEITLDLDLAIASLTFDNSYDAGSFASGGGGAFFWFSADLLKMWCGNGVRIKSYNLSSPADLSTLSFVTEIVISAAGRPAFFGGGTYALCKYGLGSGQSDLANYECTTPYDITTATLRYRRPFFIISSGGLRAALTHPIIMSNNRRECNWFTTGTGASFAGGRIGYGYFDIPFNFRGDGVHGVKFTDGTFVEP